MQLDGTYEFLELAQEDGVMVWKARDRESGKLIQVHLFPSEKGKEANEICRLLLNLPDRARRQVLKYGKDGESTYFVTEPLPAGERLRSWIERQGAPQAPPSIPGMGNQTLGHLQQMEVEPAPLRPVAPPAATKPATPAAPLEPRVRPIKAADPQPAPGAFTRLYKRDELPGGAAPAGSPPGMSPAQGLGAAQPPSRAPRPESSPDPLGFTGLYAKDAGRTGGTTPPGVEPSAPRPSRSESAPDSLRFTGLYGNDEESTPASGFEGLASNPETLTPAPPAPAKTGPGLETFLGLRPQAPAAPMVNRPAAERPVPPEPAPAFDLPPVPPPVISQPYAASIPSSSRRVSPPSQRPVAPPSPNLGQSEQPPKRSSAIDWRVMGAVLAAVLLIAGVVVLVAENVG